MERTTDLNVLRKSPHLFSWGEAVKLYEFGDYAVLEYHPWAVRNSRVLIGEPLTLECYHAWANGRDTGQSYHAFEGAIAGAMAYKWDGPNSQAGKLFCRMIGIVDPPEGE
jgi:hypothetical protein